jgi:hypothetical protein
MRRKIGVSLGLVLLALLVTALVVWWLPPTEPPLRVGMTTQEVEEALGESYALTNSDSTWLFRGFEEGCEFVAQVDHYQIGPNWLGTNQKLSVHYEAGGDKSVVFGHPGRVTHWEVEPLPRTRPPWLDRAMKGAGW